MFTGYTGKCASKLKQQMKLLTKLYSKIYIIAQKCNWFSVVFRMTLINQGLHGSMQ